MEMRGCQVMSMTPANQPDLPGMDPEKIKQAVMQQGAKAAPGTFASLLDGAEFKETRQLFDDKALLVGIPFAIVKVRFNQVSESRDFVSCEAITYDDRNIVFNDGSTGIRRQIVDYLRDHDYIDVGVTKPGEDVSDKPFMLWARGDERAPDGWDLMPPFVITGGLRFSDYVHPEHGESRTYYLA